MKIKAEMMSREEREKKTAWAKELDVYELSGEVEKIRVQVLRYEFKLEYAESVREILESELADRKKKGEYRGRI